jgi:hypothetical protein
LGVPNTLQDPTLELHDGSGATIASNDDWKARPDGTSQQGEIEATALMPTHDKESAIVQTLAPGSYTMIVRGANDTAGVAIVEAYTLQ